MESVDHTADCPMQLFFSELQMAVKALLKQTNIPLHQVQGFPLFICVLWFMETELYHKTYSRGIYMYVCLLSFIEIPLCLYMHVLNLMPTTRPRLCSSSFPLVPSYRPLPRFPYPTMVHFDQAAKHPLTYPERYQNSASEQHGT